ncbi:MAG: MoaD/ThiS family protein [Gammaproteobacteria bacterium]
MSKVRITLPFHLQTLASCGQEVEVEVQGTVSVLTVIRALEAKFPMLKGTIIDHYSNQRRPKVRFFACSKDVSLQALDTELPAAVASGEEPLMVVGAISGG